MPDASRTSWLTQLRERGAIRAASSYAVIAWLIIGVLVVVVGVLLVKQSDLGRSPAPANPAIAVLPFENLMNYFASASAASPGSAPRSSNSTPGDDTNGMSITTLPRARPSSRYAIAAGTSRSG